METIDEVFGLLEEEQGKTREAEQRLDEAITYEGNIWSQKAYQSWQGKGDRCPTFFHKLVNAKATRNKIDGLIIEGKFQRDEMVCIEHMRQYFKELFEEK